jgi:cytochrome c biogenesis protein CcdA
MPAGWLATTFVAGLLTFLSPCILPMVPIYIANIARYPLAEQVRRCNIHNRRDSIDNRGIFDANQ